MICSGAQVRSIDNITHLLSYVTLFLDYRKEKLGLRPVIRNASLLGAYNRIGLRIVVSGQSIEDSVRGSFVVDMKRLSRILGLEDFSQA
jgi:hypothetical protein